MRDLLNKIVSDIQKQEKKLSTDASSFMEEVYRMTVYQWKHLRELLSNAIAWIKSRGTPSMSAIPTSTDTTVSAELTRTNNTLHLAKSTAMMG
ncbi:Tetracycline regulation of excision, RteC [Galbibacter marinus]|uniref:Tetracycline regulation of excision, RteC n=1 Tax=Galbibacter marinus TaxID=555500 RepID=K2Q3A5_9FLAO|nr:hypothetical protein [Galbibacter marinus]EKF55291.1 Tetracycline regulation of excision, RteC [Galbibacter marinus]